MGDGVGGLTGSDVLWGFDWVFVSVGWDGVDRICLFDDFVFDMRWLYKVLTEVGRLLKRLVFM